MPLRQKFVKAGSWQTLETFWNAQATAFFKFPKGLKIKILLWLWLVWQGPSEPDPRWCHY